jgi:flagellar basal-body rod protein FlgF
VDAAGYVALTRQTGLLREMETIAQNIANVSTTGYRREGLIFAEHVRRAGDGMGSVSMAHAHARHIDLAQGPLTRTGGTFDFAIEGPGFFQLLAGDAPELTRAGVFGPNGEGLLAAADGALLLDAGGAPIFVPPDAAEIVLASDGSLSADGRPIALIAPVMPADPTTLSRRDGARFSVTGDVEPMPDSRVLQGFVEAANVDPMAEIARMIEVQHAYQLGQSFLEKEDERIRATVRTLGQ